MSRIAYRGSGAFTISKIFEIKKMHTYFSFIRREWRNSWIFFQNFKLSHFWTLSGTKITILSDKMGMGLSHTAILKKIHFVNVEPNFTWKDLFRNISHFMIKKYFFSHKKLDLPPPKKKKIIIIILIWLKF